MNEGIVNFIMTKSTKNIIILTANGLRHQFFRKSLADISGINVLRSYCEGAENSLEALVEKSEGLKTLQSRHLEARNSSEQDFFGSWAEVSDEKSRPKWIKGGQINQQEHIQDIIDLNPDVIVAYGCSWIKGELIPHFKGRFLNVHLGLSPYYRGAGTNYWPLVNGEPEYVGATFMYLDAGLDTGDIIHQIRARVLAGDSPHDIGNRLIEEIPKAYAAIIQNAGDLPPMAQPALKEAGRYYRNKDFGEDNTQKLYDNFKQGMVENYLNDYAARVQKVPLVINSILGAVPDNA